MDEAIHPDPTPAPAEGAPKESAFKRMGDQMKNGWQKFSESCKKAWADMQAKMKKEKPASSEQVEEVKEEVKDEVKAAA